MVLAVEAFGEVRLCSSAMDSIYDLQQEKVNLKEILNSNRFQIARDTFTKGDFPKVCNRTWNHFVVFFRILISDLNHCFTFLKDDLGTFF